ncbi:SERINE/THREONINE-PROTEIN KINASE [Salix koriyanagi]|uniref:non-specific serine/threonine protein kinase n=1 Tax=Salix koriyanagi TaxID=2511006 RepID=A0A9Q0PFW6_9ROSI|nr:SERINE/THREONINE-PROTEIN KINASE [Salix koriyanagi]
MGHCCSKDEPAVDNIEVITSVKHPTPPSAASEAVATPPPPVTSGFSSSFQASPFQSPLPAGVRPSPSPASTPGRKFRWPFPPPSPAKPIMAIMRRRGLGKQQPKEGPIPEEGGGEGGEARERGADGAGAGDLGLDKSFGYPNNLAAKYELGKELGRGHFGHTCWAKGKKGEVKGQPVAVKIISKAKMTTALSIEDVRREVKILKALSGHSNTIKFYDAFEDENNVYVVMELCEGGELLDRILSRGGRYTEEDAKTIVVQILNVVAYCHLQGVVHRDLKPEVCRYECTWIIFYFTSRDEDAPLRIIDFGLSDFVRPDEHLNDIVGSAYYVAPEVLRRSYNLEADMWSIGVIIYILLCGSRPFWARTESGIFRSVLRSDPNFDDSPWPNVSPEAKDFVQRLLNKDHRKRMTAAQALSHPWLRDSNEAMPLDIFIFKMVKSYICATSFKRAALKALAKAIPEDELVYLRTQFSLLEPKNGSVSLDNFRVALAKHVTDAMKESRVPDILNLMQPLAYKAMGFEEFCAAAISTYQLEALEGWDSIATAAFGFFEQEGNQVISVEELALEMNLGPTAHSVVKDCIRSSDGKLSFLGYTKLLHGVTIRISNARYR